jgi:drug/metabolite transporter (DMT)-like permease
MDSALAKTSAAERAPWAGLALAVAGALAFSGKGILAKLMYRHGVDAIQVMFWRMLLALPLFLALAWWAGRGKAALTPRDRLAVAGLGFCGYYLASLLDFQGLQHVSAGLERLILYLNPTLVLMLSVLVLGRRVAWRQLVAMALSYAGVLIVFGQELRLQSGPETNVALGGVLVLGSALSYAVYLVASGELVGRLGALRLTGTASSVACAFTIAHMLLLRPLSAVAVPEPVLWLSLVNALFTTFAPVVMMMMAVERIGATLAAQCGMLGPVSTVVLGAVVLGEAFTAWVAAGTALVLAGVWLLARWK